MATQRKKVLVPGARRPIARRLPAGGRIPPVEAQLAELGLAQQPATVPARRASADHKELLAREVQGPGAHIGDSLGGALSASATRRSSSARMPASRVSMTSRSAAETVASSAGLDGW